MNWIGVLANRETDGVEDTPYDEDLFGVMSERGGHLEMLEYWLDKEFWDFNRGYCQFDGASEGHCILAGIEPENSMLTIDQYGPAFLPDSLQFYGYSTISAEDQWRLKEAIDRRISDLKSLGLKGRVRSREALEICAKFELGPPWLDAANNDFECAKRLPARLRTNSEIIRRISRDASSKGGRQRASKNAKTELLSTAGREEFKKLEEQDFRKYRADTSDRIVATKVADKIYQALSERVGEEMEVLPELTTVQSSVRKWIKNLAK